MYLKRIPKHLYGVGLRRSLVGGCLLLVFGKTAVQITYHHHVVSSYHQSFQLIGMKIIMKRYLNDLMHL